MDNTQTTPKWFTGAICKNGDVVTNPFSKESYALNALELSIYDFIIGTNYLLENSSHTVSKKIMQDFRKALNWFRKNNPTAYYVLLD
jgi:hypothetical protein